MSNCLFSLSDLDWFAKMVAISTSVIGSIAADQEGLALDLTLVEVETGRLLRQRRELLPSQEVGKPEDSVRFQNGRVFQKRGNWANAIVCFTQAIEERGAWPLYLVQRGICQHKLRQWDAALADYDQGLRSILRLPMPIFGVP